MPENTLSVCRNLYGSVFEERRYAYAAGKPIGFYAQKIAEPKKSFSEYKEICSRVLRDVSSD